MTRFEKKEWKEIQKFIRELYWKACKGENVAGYLEALDFRIECEIFGYDGD